MTVKFSERKKREMKNQHKKMNLMDDLWTLNNNTSSS